MEPAEAAPVVTRGRVFAVAWPLILSNLSVPLLGLVDTAVVGNLGDAALIGAIAVGAMAFSFVYWGFGFLRMGTTGLVSQAHGAADREGAKVITYRALLLALVLALILLVLQPLIFAGALNLISASAAVEASAAS